MIESLFHTDYWFSRFIIQRALGGIYLIAFLNAANQFRPLVGENGLLPVRPFLEHHSFWKSPSIFHWHYSDRFFGLIAWTGVLLSLAALTGLSDSGPLWLSMLTWFLLWVLYLSIMNVGRTFYGFGWESMTVEAGFYAIFLGPVWMATPVPVIWFYCWMLFRVEFGAGMIKMRGDRCWRKLTCLCYHHETQPLPNTLSRYFHLLPRWFHKTETLGNHFVQLIAVWGLFLPQPIASVSASLIILTQGYLVISGNYSWLNCLTIFLAFSGFSDGVFEYIFVLSVPEMIAPPPAFGVIMALLILLITILSIQPIRNFLSSRQLMNYSFNPFHIVNTYGAFGSVTRERLEIVIEGTGEQSVGPNTEWKAYEFKGKPGNPYKVPPQVSPYHLRLDWQMWFAAMSSYRMHPWFLPLIKKLLQNDRELLGLLRHNPFASDPPIKIRARLYHYRYATPEERRDTGRWWIRELRQEYLRPVSLNDLKADTG